MPSISVVIPVLNDAAVLERLLTDLGSSHLEVVVVDGGSQDNSAAVAGRFGYRVFNTPPNRGLQLNTGVRHSTGAWLWLLHADSTVSPAIVAAVAEIANGPAGWGRFDVEFAALIYHEVRGFVLVAEGVSADDDGLGPLRHETRDVLAEDGLAENCAI